MTHPFNMPQTWDAVADGYAEGFLSTLEQYSARAIDAARLQPSWHILDVACGPGTFSVLAAPRVAAVTAADFSPEMLERCRARTHAAGLANVEIVEADGQNLPFAPNTFDAAFSMFGLFMFPDRAAGFSEMYRVLRPGARASISTWVPIDESPAMSLMMGAIQAVAGDLPPPEGVRLDTQEQVLTEMSAAGFSNVEVERVSYLHQVDEDLGLHWRRMVAGSAPLAMLKRALGPEEWERRAPAGRQYLERDATPGMRLEMPALLAFGTKPTT